MPLKKYDSEERTALFGKAIIEFAKMLLRNIINNPQHTLIFFLYFAIYEEMILAFGFHLAFVI